MKTSIALICVLFVSVFLASCKKEITLQERAKKFLNSPIPKDLNYVPNSISENIIVEYAETGTVNLDPEMSEVFQIILLESSTVENAKEGTSEAYLNESSRLLNAIFKEVMNNEYY